MYKQLRIASSKPVTPAESFSLSVDAQKSLKLAVSNNSCNLIIAKKPLMNACQKEVFISKRLEGFVYLV